MSTHSSISGVTYDQDQNPLPGVFITAEGQDNENTFKTMSNEDGSFLFRELPPGVYVVLARMDSFMDWKKPVLTKADQNVIVSLTMYSE